MRRCASFFTCRTDASRRTLRCCETAGELIRKFRPISEALSSPFLATRRTIPLLVSSASAAKAFMGS